MCRARHQWRDPALEILRRTDQGMPSAYFRIIVEENYDKEANLIVIERCIMDRMQAWHAGVVDVR